MDRTERKIRTALLVNAAERQRLELAIPVCMLWDCCRSIGEHPKAAEGDKEFWRHVMPDLQLAALQPFSGLPLARWNAARELSVLVARWGMVEFSGRPVITMTMATLRWIEALLNADVLEMVEGSCIDTALTRILAELQGNEDLAAGVDRSAAKLARHMHARFRALGLYADADLFAIPAKEDAA